MTTGITFDEIMSLAARKGPFPVVVEAWGGKTVFIRDPSSSDVDEWRMYCSRNQSAATPFAAKLVQIMLCDESGEKIVPQTDEGMKALASLEPRGIDEIAKACLELVNDPTPQDIDEEKKA